MTIAMIRAAAARAEGRVRRRPPLTSPTIDALVGRRVPMQAETLPWTGSFSFSGGWAAVAWHPKLVPERGGADAPAGGAVVWIAPGGTVDDKMPARALRT
jgi:hypothetical protein